MALSFSASSSKAASRPTTCGSAELGPARRDRRAALQPAGPGRGREARPRVRAAPASIRYLHTSPDDAEKAAQRLRDGELGGSAYVPPPVSETTDRRDRAADRPRDDRADRPGDGARPTRRRPPTDAGDDRPGGDDRHRDRAAETATAEAPVETAPPATTAAARRRRRRAVNLIDRRLGPAVRGVRRAAGAGRRPRRLGPGGQRRLAERRGAEPADRDGRRSRARAGRSSTATARSWRSPRTRRP